MQTTQMYVEYLFHWLLLAKLSPDYSRGYYRHDGKYVAPYRLLSN
jgi:hypothetical protein